MQKTDIYVAQMLADLVGRKTGEISKVDYSPQKPEFPAFDEQETSIPRSTPESCAISSKWITRLFRDLAQIQNSSVHRIMIVKDGFVIGETSYAPYTNDCWHVSHSLCKSITGMAVGLLIDEGKLSLEEKVLDILRDDRGPIARMLPANAITVRHLLTMSSGVKYNEAGAVAGNKWLRDYLNAGSNFAPGSSFEYNSMNSYVLSAIISRKTGETLTEYLRPRLFEPLGIRRFFWEESPEHVVKGGWGMFLRIEDMAKLGMLYLQNGKWQGRQIIPEEWVRESTQTQIRTGMDHCAAYGYHLWILEDRPGAFYYNGMLGQNVFCYPDLNMVICTQAGNAEVFQKGEMSNCIRKAVRGLDTETASSPLPEDLPALNELKMLCRRLSGRTAPSPGIASGGWPHEIHGRKQRNTDAHVPSVRRREMLRRLWSTRLDGTRYELDIQGEGIFPLIMQVFHNNFTDGIRSIGFRKTGNGGFCMDLYEGEQVYTIPCGFHGTIIRSRIDMHGEIYDIAVQSEFTTDEYGRAVLKNLICFDEEAASREINIYLDERSAGSADEHDAPEKIEVRMDEHPGSEMIVPTLQMITTDKATGLDGFFIKLFSSHGGMDIVRMVCNATIRPSLCGTLMKNAKEETV